MYDIFPVDVRGITERFDARFLGHVLHAFWMEPILGHTPRAEAYTVEWDG